MLDGCSSLEELDLSNFNISNVDYIGDMPSGYSFQLKNKIRAQYKNIKELAFFTPFNIMDS